VSITCGADHCVTCSDEAQPMRVVSLEPCALASCVDRDGGTSEVMMDLVGAVAVGDVVLVHAGVAIAVGERREHRR
jgi:hydrogenase maturation factor